MRGLLVLRHTAFGMGGELELQHNVHTKSRHVRQVVMDISAQRDARRAHGVHGERRSEFIKRDKAPGTWRRIGANCGQGVADDEAAILVDREMKMEIEIEHIARFDFRISDCRFPWRCCSRAQSRAAQGSGGVNTRRNRRAYVIMIFL